MLFRRLSAAVLLIVLASCATPAPKAPPPGRTPLPMPPPPLPQPMSSDWRDWPVTPGDWSYARDAAGSTAAFGERGAMPLLTLRCDPSRQQIVLTRAHAGSAAADLTIRTSSMTRTVRGDVGSDAAVVVALAARDPLLDAMGFSRGRFVIEQPRGTRLVAPAWAEVLRVAEDCRQ